HAAGIALYRRINKLFDFRKCDNLVKLLADFKFTHPQNGTVQEYVFPPGKFRMKAGAYLQERSDPALDAHLPPGRGRHARKDFEQGALTGAVPPDTTENFALL